MKQTNYFKIKRQVRWAFLSSLCGLFAGFAAFLFLFSLEWATTYRESHHDITLFLPLGGLCIGLLFHYFGKSVAKGTNLILDEIHDPKHVIPFRMSPLVLFSTFITHLFGASAGREGAIVQVAATLSDQLSRFFHVEREERRILLIAGTGAGFSAAIGAPWAGMIFGMEVVRIGRLRPFAVVECFIASFVAYYSVSFLGAKHTPFSAFDLSSFTLMTLACVIFAGVIFGFCALLFTKVTHRIEKFLSRHISYGPLKTFLVGFILIGLFHWEGTRRFEGLGIPQILNAMYLPTDFSVPALKGLFTALTVGSGFKGGEFIPLVFMGTTLGSALSMVLPVSIELLSRLGFAAVFAAASNTPVACTIMAAELFGLQILPFAFVACFTAYYSSGHHGIYRSQKTHSSSWFQNNA